MKINVTKCNGCGAHIKVKKGDTAVTCPYCGTTYTVSEDNEKKVTQHIPGAINGFDRRILIIFIPGIVMIVFMIILFSVIFGTIASNSKNTLNTAAQQVQQKQDVWDFNYKYHNGTMFGKNVGLQLDDVITSNKTNPNKKIVVKYKDKSTTTTEEILQIKKEIANYNNYEVIFDYDEKGYISTFSIYEQDK